MNKAFTSFFEVLNNITSVQILASIAIIIAATAIIADLTGLSMLGVAHKILAFIQGAFSRRLSEKEKTYRRNLMITKNFEKSKKAAMYRWLNDLIIDLGYKKTGVRPFEFLFVVELISGVIALVLSLGIFKSLFMMIILYPVTMIAIFCALYTRANVAHDARIRDIMSAENIISANAKGGIIKAIKDSITMLPKSLVSEFEACVFSVEHENYHVKVALEKLGDELGSTSYDFIKKKCIDYELSEEEGAVGVFKDVIEINGIKTVIRDDIKRKIEATSLVTITCIGAIFAVFAGLLAFLPDVRNVYFGTSIGKVVLILDIIFGIALFVYCTYLRAKEI